MYYVSILEQFILDIVFPDKNIAGIIKKLLLGHSMSNQQMGHSVSNQPMVKKCPRIYKNFNQ